MERQTNDSRPVSQLPSAHAPHEAVQRLGSLVNVQTHDHQCNIIERQVDFANLPLFLCDYSERVGRDDFASD